jgi:hypothetical protein
MAWIKRTSVGLLAATLLADNEKLTFVEGSVRTFDRARPGRGRSRARRERRNDGPRPGNCQDRALNISADALLADYFTVNGKREDRYREARLSLDAPLKLGRRQISTHGHWA